MAFIFGFDDMQKALHCWRTDNNDLRLAVDDAADERITVGGYRHRWQIFVMDGECSAMRGEKSPVRD